MRNDLLRRRGLGSAHKGAKRSPGKPDDVKGAIFPRENHSVEHYAKQRGRGHPGKVAVASIALQGSPEKGVKVIRQADKNAENVIAMSNAINCGDLLCKIIHKYGAMSLGGAI